MARKSFIRRIADTLRQVFRPEPPSRPAPPPPPPPPERGGGGGGGGFRRNYRDIWDDTVTDADIADSQERTGYSENELFQLHFEVLYSLDPEASEDELEAMWQDYLEAFVTGDMTHDIFFETWNIDPRDFDWAMWREAMGYGKKLG